MTEDQKDQLIVSMKGDVAESGSVPAFTALESVHGLSQAIMMIIHFANSGEIRRRNFKELDVDFRLSGTKRGSFEFVFEFSKFAPFLFQAYGEALGNGSWQLIKTVLNRVIGLDGDKDIEEAEQEGRINSGDLAALIQAVEPSVRKAHSVVNHGSNNVQIFINGDKNVVNFDSSSKEFLHENIFNDETRSQRFLVTSFDGRNRTGRVFDLDEEQAFTFDLLPEADRRSLTVIVHAASAYALRQKGEFNARMEVVCAFTSVDAPDGRTKRLKVFAAAKEFEQLKIHGFDPTKGPTKLLSSKNNDDLIED